MSVTLADVTAALQTIAPLHLAEDWDNVGLLIEPSTPQSAERILLTIDLTKAVVTEAIESGAKMIVAYHPPIFAPLKRIDGNLAALIENHVAVYSPHTALDAAPGGVSDWLAGGLADSPQIFPFGSPRDSKPCTTLCKLVVFVPADHVDALRNALVEQCYVGQIGDYTHCTFNVTGTGTFLGGGSTQPTVGKPGELERVDEMRVEMVCNKNYLHDIRAVIRRVHPYEEPAFDVYPLIADGDQPCSVAKHVIINEPATVDEIVNRIKSHLGLDHVRVASPNSHASPQKLNRIAVCPGAGGSLFADDRHAQVYLTGEMRHHDVLAKVEQGATVILTDHTHTERGYLPTLKQKLHEQLGTDVKIDISKVDADPLRIV